jgi:toxin-antitoxin system PIN domain toxin
MILCDVNVLVYAHREDASPEHGAYADWLTVIATGPSGFGLSEAVLSGFIRVVTNPRIFQDPTPLELALQFCEELRKRPQARILRPGNRNWKFLMACVGKRRRGESWWPMRGMRPWPSSADANGSQRTGTLPAFFRAVETKS